MNINWFTVVAQIINFLILVWLLKKFLYQPVLDSMDQRQKKLAFIENEVKQNNENAKLIKEKYIAKEKAFDGLRKVLLLEANQNADAKRKALIEEAHQHVEELRKKWKNTLEQEQQLFLKKLSQQISEGLLLIVRKFMTRLSSKDIDEQLVLGFCRSLNDVSGDQRNELLESLNNSSLEVFLRTDLILNEQSVAAIEASLKSLSPKITNIEFKKDESLTMTFEVNINSHKIVWGLDEFLHILKNNVMRLLEVEHESLLKSNALDTEKDETHA